ncbi:hypothetical protein EDB19DRAFT_1827589 [Suillus lakei]|nr:hypothetical protein EDB19DRAFT_1827589 [Suillus lakei]
MPNLSAAESMLLLSKSHPNTPSQASSPIVPLSPILLPNNPNSWQLPVILPTPQEVTVVEKENNPPLAPDPIALVPNSTITSVPNTIMLQPIKIIMSNSLQVCCLFLSMANGVTFTSSMLVLAAVGTLIPPLPPSIDPPLKAPLANNSANSKSKKGKANDFTSGKDTHHTYKFLSNLCALHWLKQIKTNGTTDKFCLYHRDLTAEHAKYKNYDDKASVLITVVLPFAMAELGKTWQLAEGLGQKLAEVQKVPEDARDELMINCIVVVNSGGRPLPKVVEDNFDRLKDVPNSSNRSYFKFTPALGETAPLSTVKRRKKGTLDGFVDYPLSKEQASHANLKSLCWEDKLKRSLCGSVATEVKQYPVVLVLEDMTGNRGNATNLLATSKKAMDQMEIGNSKQFIALTTDNPSVMQAYCQKFTE